VSGAVWLAVCSLLAILTGSSVAQAQAAAAAPAPAPVYPALTVRADVTFYGDNTEFFNQFRVGETLLGASGRVFLDAAVNEHATLRVGAFTNGRFVSEDSLRDTRPIVALILSQGSSRFIFGTLETVERRDGIGPDRTSPHGLLPPIQVETLAFTRPNETGLQWLVSGARGAQDFWINWQRLNTAQHRESFDGGVVGHVRIAGPLQFGYQGHVVHQGGQLFGSGAVSDSYAIAPGIILAGHAGSAERALEVYWVKSSDDPNRAQSDGKRTGSGGFLRFAVTRANWRGHIIIWRSYDLIKAEGDPNYQAVRLNGPLFLKTRDYSEVGLTRLFLPANDVFFEASFRLHRVENAWNYSYRLLARVKLAFPVPHGP
jgi:hypothetical protein